MKRPKSIALLVSVLFGTVLLSLSVYADDGRPQDVADISKEEFSKLHKSLVPKMARWKTVLWQTSLLKAQNMAARASIVSSRQPDLVSRLAMLARGWRLYKRLLPAKTRSVHRQGRTRKSTG